MKQKHKSYVLPVFWKFQTPMINWCVCTFFFLNLRYFSFSSSLRFSQHYGRINNCQVNSPAVVNPALQLFLYTELLWSLLWNFSVSYAHCTTNIWFYELVWKVCQFFKWSWLSVKIIQYWFAEFRGQTVSLEAYFLFQNVEWQAYFSFSSQLTVLIFWV